MYSCHVSIQKLTIIIGIKLSKILTYTKSFLADFIDKNDIFSIYADNYLVQLVTVVNRDNYTICSVIQLIVNLHYSQDDYGRVQERQEFVRMAPYGDYQVEYLTTDKFHYGRDGGKPIGHKSVSIRILSNNGIIHEDFASSRL